jgi:pentatricopeptide repeat protein
VGLTIGRDSHNKCLCLDLGVNTLKMMRIRKLASEAITYKSLIEACGRCGIAHRATQLLEMMTQDGLSIDSEVYYCFMKAFSHGDTEATMSSHHADTLSEVSAYAPSGVSAISSNEQVLNRRGSCESSATIGSKLSKQSARFLGEINHAMTSSLEENRRAFKTARSKRMSRLFKQTLTKEKDVIVTKAVRTHLDLSNCILDDLYPGLVIATDSDTCPKCSCVLSQDSIIVGWTPCEVKDFSTTCPSCKHKFVPKFSVSCSLDSFEGSQGQGTTLFVDYLSPWVLLRQIKNRIAQSSGMEAIIDPVFRQGTGINATLWWNIIVTFKRFKIPYTFLLQGSFPDQQLIMPTLEDEM